MSAPLFFEVPRQQVLRLKNVFIYLAQHGLLLHRRVRRGLAVADSSGSMPSRGAEAALATSFRDASERSTTELAYKPASLGQLGRVVAEDRPSVTPRRVS